ncbi:hypothetical protein, partial [Streptomyces sp. NPDC059071]|uniref:hypothetical protein n=1 Tax=Streptomyces sp. NPDC059071 TaxID=3346714 RepID=UPI0036B78D52
MPVDDISDTAVVQGLAQLTRSSDLSTAGELAAAFGDVRRRVALSKSRTLIYRVSFTSDAALHAANSLTRRFRLHTAPQPTWSVEMSLVADLVDIAISTAESDASAAEVVETLHREFDLHHTAMVAETILRNPNEHRPTDDGRTSRYEAALRNHRRRQLEACLQDLDGETPTGRWSGVVYQWGLLDEPTRTKLTSHAEATVQDWANLVQLADRFVEI